MNFHFLQEKASEVAPKLLGCVLERKIENKIIRVRIVETEAYDQTDVASHSFRGETERTKVMFGPAGHLYVYFTYGMHYCCNIVTGKSGEGSAVLIRAVEPLERSEVMERLRGKSSVEVSNGPAKLCQALCIDSQLNGHDLHRAPLRLIPKRPTLEKEIIQTTRIGIRHGKEVPWRFYLKENPYVSKV